MIAAILIAVLGTVVALLVQLVPTTLKCTRVDDHSAWTCEVKRWRSKTIVIPLSSTRTVAMRLDPLDDAGGRLMVNGLELARFSPRGVSRALHAAHDLSESMSEPGRRYVAFASRTLPILAGPRPLRSC